MTRSIGPTNGVGGCRRKNCSTPMWRAGSVVGRSFVVLRLLAFLRAVPSCTPRHFDLAQQRLPTTCTMMATTTRTRTRTRTASLLWWTQVQTLPRPATVGSRPPRPTAARSSIDDVNSGGNAGNAIGVGDTYGDVPVDFELLYEVAALVNQSRDQAIRAPSCFDLYVKRLPQIGNLTPQLIEEVAVIMGRSRRCLRMVRRFLVAVRS